MARQFLVPVALPGDPTAALQAATKQYVDNHAGTSNTVRTVTANTTAVVGEILMVDATAGPITITPPTSPVIGNQVVVVKTDTSANIVTWNGPVNSDATATFEARWAAAVLVFDGSVFVADATSVPSGSSGVPASRQLVAGGGLTGGGDLSADRTFAVSYGTSAGTAAQGNDARLSDTRTPTDATVTDAKVASAAAIAESKLALATDAVAATASRRTLGTGSQQAAAGNHAHAAYAPLASPTFTGTVTLPGDPTAALGAATKQYVDSAAYVPTSTKGAANGVASLDGSGDLQLAQLPPSVVTTSQRGPIGGVSYPTYSASMTIDPTVADKVHITATGALTLTVSTTGAVDGQQLLVRVVASGANRAVTLSGALLTAGRSSPYTVTSGSTGYLGFEYDSSVTAWTLLAQTQRS